MNDTDTRGLIGIMSVVHEGRFPFGKQTYFFEDMVRHSEIDSDRLFFFSPLAWKSESVQVKGYKYIDGIWESAREPIPSIIYDRAFSKDEAQKVHLEACRKFLMRSKFAILNPFDLTHVLNDKVAFHTFLMTHQVPTLDTLPFSALNETLFRKNITTWYLKPTFGSKGEGIFVIEKKQDKYLLFDQYGDAQAFTQFTDLTKILKIEIKDSDRYFIQAAANIHTIDSAPFDIRVLVQNTGSEYIISGKAVRIGQKNAKTSNLNAGGHALPFTELEYFWQDRYSISVAELEAKIGQLCLNCSDILQQEFGDFCEIGYDVLVTWDRGPIIIEGNAKPSRWVFVKMADYLKNLGRDDTIYLDKRKETVRMPIQYALHLMRHIQL